MSEAMIAMKTILILLTVAAVILAVIIYFLPSRFKRVFKIIIVVSILIVSIGSVGLLVIMRGIHNGANEDNTVINMRSAYYLLTCSAACGVIGLCVLTNLIKLNQHYKIGALTGIAFLVVLFLQMSVVIGYPYADEALSSKDHQIAHTLLYTLQYFSLDAGYANIVDIGQKLFGGTGIIHIFHIIAGSMTVLAPLVGGFAIFDILGRFFPKIRLFFNRKTVKYVFSELNRYSIETAESIYRLRKQLLLDKKKRYEFKQKHGNAEYCEIVDSVIIFTDVYTDKGSENSSELLKRAKDIDAICLKDDVLNLRIYWIFGNIKFLFYRVLNFLFRKKINKYINRKTVYFLVDGNDFDAKQGVENNLQTAVSLYSTRSNKTVWTKTQQLQLWTRAYNMEMYVFTRNEKADTIIGAARDEWEKNFLIGKKNTDDLAEFYANAFVKLEKVEGKIQKAQLQELQVQKAQNDQVVEQKDVFNAFIELYKDFVKSINVPETISQLTTVAEYLNELKKIAKKFKDEEQIQDATKKCGKSKTETMRMFAELCNAFVKAINAQNEKGQAVDVSFDSEIELLNEHDKRHEKYIKKLVNNAFKQIKAARILTANGNANSEFTKYINDFKYYKSNKNKKKVKENKKNIKKYLRKKARFETDIYDAVKCVNKELHDAVNPNINVWNKKRVSSVFKCINEYRNLVYNLLDGDREKDECNAQSVPLYTALKREKGYDTGKLNVLIVGSGRIAKEFLKATYWCGQMLDNRQNSDNRQEQSNEQVICPTKLRIGVLSLDADQSRQQFEFDMPEVFAADRCNYNGNENSYCEFRFVEAEFGTKLFKSEFDKFINGEIWKSESDNNVGGESAAEKKPAKKSNAAATSKSAAENIETAEVAPAAKISGETERGCNNAVDIDYVLVALGSDEVNMRAAEWISREIARKKAPKNKTVNYIPVNYVIENGELCDSLRESVAGAINANGVLLNPFGSLRDRFEYGNIRMSDAERRALIANCAYGNDGGKEEFMLDSYSRGSSIAVAIHNSYKNTCIPQNAADNEKRAVWLEHRRWNAYMRSEGYRCHTEREFNDFALERDTVGEITKLAHKNVDLKLHACLVEAKPSEIKDNGTKIKNVSKNIKGVLKKNKAAIEKILAQHISEKDINKILEGIRQQGQAADGFDDLDTLSVIKNILNENVEERIYNFKDNDISIYKNLVKDGYDKKVREILEKYYKKTDDLAVLNSELMKEMEQAKNLFNEHTFFDEGDSTGTCTDKCVYNSNVIKKKCKNEGSKCDKFILLCEWREYDIVAAFVNGSLKNAPQASAAKIFNGKKPFIVEITPENGGNDTENRLLIGIPHGVSADVQLKRTKGNAEYYISVEENEGYQKSLGIYLNGCLVGKKQKPGRVS